jgi:hypothetical protein
MKFYKYLKVNFKGKKIEFSLLNKIYNNKKK